MELRCAVCQVQACREEPDSKPYPRFCPMALENEEQALAEARATYGDQETRELAQAAARTEAAGYCKEPRVEEVMGFARRLGVHPLIDFSSLSTVVEWGKFESGGVR